MEKVQEGQLKQGVDGEVAIEINNDIPKKLDNVSSSDKDFDTFKEQYKGSIDEAFKQQYGEYITDENLWEDTAKELYLASKNNVLSGEEYKPSTELGELEKQTESKEIKTEHKLADEEIDILKHNMEITLKNTKRFKNQKKLDDFIDKNMPMWIDMQEQMGTPLVRIPDDKVTECIEEDKDTLNEGQYEEENRKGSVDINNIINNEYYDNEDWYKEHIKDYKDVEDFVQNNIAEISSEYSLNEDEAKEVCEGVFGLAKESELKLPSEENSDETKQLINDYLDMKYNMENKVGLGESNKIEEDDAKESCIMCGTPNTERSYSLKGNIICENCGKKYTLQEIENKINNKEEGIKVEDKEIYTCYEDALKLFKAGEYDKCKEVVNDLDIKDVMDKLKKQPDIKFKEFINDCLNDKQTQEFKEIKEESTARDIYNSGMSEYLSKGEDRTADDIKVLAENEDYILTGCIDEEQPTMIHLSVISSSDNDRSKKIPEVYIDQDYKGKVLKAQVNWSAYGSVSVEEAVQFSKALVNAANFAKEIDGKDYADVVKGTEPTTESNKVTKTTKEYRIMDGEKVLKIFSADEREKGYNEMRAMGKALKDAGKEDNLIYKEFTVRNKLDKELTESIDKVANNLPKFIYDLTSSDFDTYGETAWSADEPQRTAAGIIAYHVYRNGESDHTLEEIEKAVLEHFPELRVFGRSATGKDVYFTKDSKNTRSLTEENTYTISEERKHQILTDILDWLDYHDLTDAFEDVMTESEDLDNAIDLGLEYIDEHTEGIQDKLIAYKDVIGLSNEEMVALGIMEEQPKEDIK